MKTTAQERMVMARKGLPVDLEIGGQILTFYPITMSNYEEFLAIKNALTVRMTSLPVEYMAMSYLGALWAMDYDSVAQTGKAFGLFERILRFLCLSLRLGQGCGLLMETKADDKRQLLSIILTTSKDGKTVKMTTKDFGVYVRPLLAEQNGLEIPDESYNPELVEAERILAEKGSSNLKFDPNTLIASVAYASHLSERDIDSWSVIEFERRRKAIERDKMFMLYQGAKLGGMVTFKGADPYPSWCLDVEEAKSSALRNVSETAGHFSAIGDLGQALSTLNPKQ